MTKTLKHRFSSSIADGTDATLVRPSNWNDDHDFWWGYRTVATTTDTISNADHLTLIVYSAAGATTVSLPAPASGNMPTGWRTRIRRTGAAALTLSGTGGATINGSASVTLNQGDTYDLHSTGAADYVAIAHPAPSAAAPTAVIIGGILKYVSATALSFLPFQGNQIVINGSTYTIPAIGNGIAGLANAGVFVNGVAAQNLAANTSYFVYAFNNAGTITADYSTTNHATSIAAGNSGTEIKSGDETRSLIGLCHTNASSQFQNDATYIGVLSWFNRRRKSGTNKFSVDRGTAANPFTEINTEIRINFLTWGDEFVQGIATGMVSVNAIAYAAVGIAFDSTTTPTAAQNTIIVSTGYYNTFSLAPILSLSEGFHYVTLLGGNNSAGSATTTFNANDTSGSAAYQSACRLYVSVQG